MNDTPRRSWKLWLVLGPLFMAAGALLGPWLLPNGGARVWSGPESRASEPKAERTAHGTTASPALPGFADLVARVKAGVVGVRTLLEPEAAATLTPEDIAGQPPSKLKGVVYGTGFVVHKSGLVVTNQHVIAGHASIIVEVPGYPPTEADVVGEDALTDLAVLRLQEVPNDLVVLSLGASEEVRQGEWVVTIGNPFEFRHSVTAGIVSYVGRHLPEDGTLVTNEYLQITAPVWPGSSGGPVLNTDGHVVAVTRRAASGQPGLSFAVPSKVVKWVLDSMEKNHGRVRRGFLGVRIQPLLRPQSESLGMRTGGGALILQVEEGKPAHRGGLKQGDVVISWNGRAVDSAYELYDWITWAPPGSEAVIEIVRGGVRLPELRVEIGEVRDPAAKTGPRD